eukprot:Gb_12129 [translate_table: standard]
MKFGEATYEELTVNSSSSDPLWSCEDEALKTNSQAGRATKAVEIFNFRFFLKF